MKPPHQPARERRKAFYTRLAVAGFLLVPASLVVAIATGNVIGVFGSPLPLIAASLVFAVVIWATGRFFWGALAVALLTLLASLAFGLIFLPHLDSLSDFVPSLMRVAGAGTAAVGAAAAAVQRRRGTLRPAGPHERKAAWAFSGALLALFATSAVLTYTQASTVDAPAGAVVVEMEGDDFIPDEIEIDGPSRIFVANLDSYAHTFTVEGLQVDQYIGPRASRTIELAVPSEAARRSKDFTLVCLVTGHEDMRGKIRVS